ncbi:phage morphogenesis protein [Limibacterium fermenti]|uniref:phage morphogenesis protein n=1 Tax=Limibacterium fermenti TaxID=3229863 RepID=UPI000E8B837C|nr:phage morphogenesis protein [Porphyromonadaceae bacterium]
MKTYHRLFAQLLKDIKVELDDEFDRNFERKAFFSTSWESAKRNNTGSLMIRTGALRKSVKSEISGKNSIQWTSSLPYADIHNRGGKITVTPKMKGFFWYRYRLATGEANTYSIRTRKKVNNASTRRLNVDAEFWRAMALKPVGSEIIIPKRQFIGDHPVVRQRIQKVTEEWFQNDVRAFTYDQLNKLIK